MRFCSYCKQGAGIVAEYARRLRRSSQNRVFSRRRRTGPTSYGLPAFSGREASCSSASIRTGESLVVRSDFDQRREELLAGDPATYSITRSLPSITNGSLVRLSRVQGDVLRDLIRISPQIGRGGENAKRHAANLANSTARCSRTRYCFSPASRNRLNRFFRCDVHAEESPGVT